MKTFKQQSNELLYNACMIMEFRYKGSDMSIYEKHFGYNKPVCYFLINWERETIKRIDYKELETILLMLYNCNIEYPKT